MEKTTHSEGAYNYIPYFYFSPLPFHIAKSIDFLTLSISRKSIMNALEIDSTVMDHVSIRETLKGGGFQCKTMGHSNKVVKKGGIKKGYEYCDEYFHPDYGSRIFLWYSPKSILLPPLYMKIHDPNNKVIRLLYRFFNSYHVQVKLSEVELTFDFFADDRIGFSDFLRNHLFLKYQHSKSFWFGYTFYLNNIRKSCMGMRVYGKVISQCPILRMELVLKREILKKQKIAHPKDLDHIDLSRFFGFMKMDKDGLREHLIWCNRDQIKVSNERRPAMGNLVIQSVDNWLSCISYDFDEQKTSLMRTVEELKSEKGIPNYSRFMVPHEDFCREFMRQVSGQTFLKAQGQIPNWG